MLIETSAEPEGQIDPLYGTSLKWKDNRGDRKKKGKVEWEAEELHRLNNTKNEALALLNQPKLLMNL